MRLASTKRLRARGWREVEAPHGVLTKQAGRDRMCGSLKRNASGRKPGAEAGVRRSLTVCAGDLCGRLAGGWLSILQTFVTEDRVNSNACKCKRCISSIGRRLISSN